MRLHFRDINCFIPLFFTLGGIIAGPIAALTTMAFLFLFPATQQFHTVLKLLPSVIAYVITFPIFIFLWKHFRLSAREAAVGKQKKFNLGQTILTVSNIAAATAMVVPLFFGVVGAFVYIYIVKALPVVLLLWIIGLILVYTTRLKPAEDMNGQGHR